MKIEAVAIIIFGGTGDLSSRKLFPALFDLYLRGYLPKHFRIVGFARRALSEEEYRQHVRHAITQEFTQAAESDLDAFLSRVFYFAGNFEESSSYVQLRNELDSLDATRGLCENRLLYLAVPPGSYAAIFDSLAMSGLTAKREVGWSRVLVEKPFGSDAESAQHLDQKLGVLFDENQVFRIDHYLAKSSVQNILAFRFSNALFEKTWSREYIERIHIKLYESRGVEDRGAFYDALGALRDVGQNHVLQLLALIAMENPLQFEGEALRHARTQVLKQLKIFTPEEISRFTRHGQYRGYDSISGVKPSSRTETYFHVTAFVDSDRWRGVPFYLESGKRMEKNLGEIEIYFKPPQDGVCHSVETSGCQNVVKIGISPHQYVSIRVWGRKNGLHFELEPHDLYFQMPPHAGARTPDGYEKVLYDGIMGDQTLFMCTEELEASWKFISPILREWETRPISQYEPGDISGVKMVTEPLTSKT